MAACFPAYPKSFAPQKCWGVVDEAGLPPGEEDLGVRGQLCRLPRDSALPCQVGNWGGQPLRP